MIFKSCCAQRIFVRGPAQCCSWFSSIYFPLLLLTMTCNWALGAEQKAPKHYDQSTDWGLHHRIRRTPIGVTRTNTFDGTSQITQTNISSYVQMETGLNYREDGQWRESEAIIELKPDGSAAALRGQHKVRFSANVNSAGGIDMIDRDGKRYRSHVLGLTYFDAESGKSVLIAELQDSIGELLPPNQIIYKHAFQGDVAADIRYTYRKSGLEQDVILTRQPPPPEEYGLNPDTTRLEVFTEFIEAPNPRKSIAVLRKEADMNKRQRMVEPDIEDEHLDFGALQFVRGKAFELGQERQGQIDNKLEIPIFKSWQQIDGRTFLIEAVEHSSVREELSRLEAWVADEPQTIREAAVKRVLPQKVLADGGSGQPILLATTRYRRTGFVLDYVTVSGQTTDYYTFLGGTTYHITGNLQIQTRAIIGNGAVLKFASSGRVTIPWGSDFTSPSSTAYLVAETDNTVGESVLGGSPVGSYVAGSMLEFDRFNGYATVANLEFRNALKALFISDQNAMLTVRDCTFRSCQYGVETFYAQGSVQNLTMCNVQTPHLNSGGQSFYVPPGAIITGCGSGGASELVSSVNPLGTPRNDWSGWIGFYFTVGSSPITVTELGRWVQVGNSGNHLIKLYHLDGATFLSSEATVQTHGKPAGQFTYAPLSSPVTLQSGNTYAVMSLETAGGDSWRDFNSTTITLNSAAHSAMACYAYPAPGFLFAGAVGGQGKTYGPVNLRFNGGAGPPPNTPPSISDIPNQTTALNTPKGPVTFSVSDAETPAGALMVSASSGNTTLVPNGNISLGGSGGNRTITVTPSQGQTGTATITVTVSDGSAQASDTFNLTVTSALAYVEISKGQMVADASTTGWGWLAQYAINGSTSDPGWHNADGRPVGTDWLRVYLGSTSGYDVGRVQYHPREGAFNGTFLEYAIYVTDSSSSDMNQWGAPVASSPQNGAWSWPNGAETRTIDFPAKRGKYVIFRCLQGAHYAPYASANEVWIYRVVNQPPTLTLVSTLTGGTEDTPFTISYGTLVAAANEFDPEGGPVSFRVEAVSSGTLTKSGVPVTPGSTLLTAGESWIWAPAANANGTLNAFTIKAWDGSLASSTPVQVSVNVAAVNDQPTMNIPANVTLAMSTPALRTYLNGISAGGGESQTLTVAAVSSNPSLLPNPVVNYTSPSGGASLDFVPEAGKTGSSTITVTVQDNGGTAYGGVNTLTRTFLINISGDSDSDYDGRSDLQEQSDGTNPNDPNSVLPVRLGYWRFNGTDFLGESGLASAGFSSTQGANHWHYKYSTVLQGVPDANLPAYDAAVSRWGGTGDTYCLIGPGWQHPGDLYDSARTFVAPQSGTITISGRVRHSNVSPNGDGVLIRVLKNSTALVNWINISPSVSYTPVTLQTTVTAGDQIHFQVNRNGKNNNDTIEWNARVSYYSFAGQDGELPTEYLNIGTVPSWSGSALNLSSSPNSRVKYRCVEENGSANINLRTGTVRFWYKPDWSSVSQSGSGPGYYPKLLAVGRISADWNYGGWGLLSVPDGSRLIFWQAAGGSAVELLSSPISWRASEWHQIVVTYSPTTSAMYLDGQLVASGAGITLYPGAMVRTQDGITIGNDRDGTSGAKGQIDELETFNYVLSAAAILSNYHAVGDTDSDGLPDWWEIQHFGNLDQNVSGDFDHDGLRNGNEFNGGSNPTTFTGFHVFTPLN